VKEGDIVKTKVPGFGTGRIAKMGTIISDRHFVRKDEAGSFEVLHIDGTFREWYPWQLEIVSEGRQ